MSQGFNHLLRRIDDNIAESDQKPGMAKAYGMVQIGIWIIFDLNIRYGAFSQIAVGLPEDLLATIGFQGSNLFVLCLRGEYGVDVDADSIRDLTRIATSQRDYNRAILFSRFAEYKFISCQKSGQA